MSGEFTPGPWSARESNTYTRDRFVIRQAHPGKGASLGFAPLCTVEGDVRLVDSATRTANARLIAAAPDLLDVALMLAACAEQVEEGDAFVDIGLESPLMHAARAAIAAATGETK